MAHDSHSGTGGGTALTTIDTPQSKYEEFRDGFEPSEGEPEMLPWVQLSDSEKEEWEIQWRKYTGEIDSVDGRDGVKHGDPDLTERHKPMR